MKFIHVTDLHLVAPGEELWGLNPMQRLQACLADILLYHPDAEFCGITGDLTDDGQISAYQGLAAELANFPIPCHLMLGNHDDRANFGLVFSSHPRDDAGFIQHRLDREEGVFLFLDTLKGPPSSAGLYCADRRAWLGRQLEKSRGRPVYLFMHHPPFSISHRLMDQIMLEEPEAFHALLQGHDIRHIFFGHAHRTISGVWRGISCSALPSICHQLPLVARSVETVYSEEPAMYGIVHLGKDSLIVHSDAFLDRRPAKMTDADAREGWL